jgi:hypothetical protein
MRKSLAPNMFKSTLCGPWPNTQRQTLCLSKTLLLKKGVGCTSLRERFLALSARDPKSATQAWSTKRGIGFEQNRHVEKGGWVQGPPKPFAKPYRLENQNRRPKPGHQKGASAFNRTDMLKKGVGARASKTGCESPSAREPKLATQAWPPKGGIGFEQGRHVQKGGWVQEPPKAIANPTKPKAEFANPNLTTKRGHRLLTEPTC